MDEEDDLLAFDLIERIHHRAGKDKAAPKPAAAPPVDAKRSGEFVKPAAWVASKKRPRTTPEPVVTSPEGSDRLSSPSPTKPSVEVVDLTSSSMSPTRPNRRFMVSSKPAPPAAAAGAASSDSAHKSEKKKAPKAKRALLPSVRALPDQAHLWTEKYAPSTEADLALFRKRVTEFRDWLTLCTSGGPARLLILTGPAGAGKTALVRVVGREMGFEVSEWLNPSRHQWSDETGRSKTDMESVFTQFRDFLLRSERYLPLFKKVQRRLVLLEDLPFLHKGKEAFSSVIQEYLKTPGFPVVLLLSDTYLASSSLYNVLSADVTNNARQVTRITVSHVAPTAIHKVLSKIASAESLKFSDEELRKIADLAGGDLRHAINELQFRSISPHINAVDEAPRSKEKRRTKAERRAAEDLAESTRSKSASVNGKDRFEDAQEAREVASARDVSLSIFHAIGKILHNKRKPLLNEDGSSPASVTRTNRGPPESEPEPVMHRIYVEPDTWVSFLHENYPRLMDDVDEAAIAMEYVSDADLIASRWQDAEALGGAVASIAARGLQYGSCHTPPPPGAGKFAAFYKPQQFQVRKQVTEIAQDVRTLFQEAADFAAFSDSVSLRTETLPYLRRIVAHSQFARTPLGPPSSAPSALGGVSRVATPAQRALLERMCSYSTQGRKGPALLQEQLRPDDAIDSTPPAVSAPAEGERPEVAAEVVRESRAAPMFDDIVEC